MDISSLLTITNDISKAIPLGPVSLRYYQIMFLCSFIGGFYIIKWMFKREGAPEAWLDSLLMYMVFGTIIGARLGHVFFYQWDYYQHNIGEIFQVWKGGLASHGAAVAIIIGLIIYSRKVTKRHPFWVLDRVVIVVALAGAFIRFGNYTNSEIYGKMANSSVETVFVEPVKDIFLNRYSEWFYNVEFTNTGQRFETDSISYPIYKAKFELQDDIDPNLAGSKLVNQIIPAMSNFKVDSRNIIAKPEATFMLIPDEYNVVEVEVLGVPRYPTQWMESLGYLFVFITLFLLYLKTNRKDFLGYFFGMFLILVFGFRFVIEYLKATQVDFEYGMALNMGQILSIPLVLFGFWLVLTSRKRIKDYSQT